MASAGLGALPARELSASSYGTTSQSPGTYRGHQRVHAPAYTLRDRNSPKADLLSQLCFAGLQSNDCTASLPIHFPPPYAE